MPQEIDVETLVERIARKVEAKAKDVAIKWNSNGSFRVTIGKLFPDGSADKEALLEIRKRFREALTKRLEPRGYTEQGYGRYSPARAADDEQEPGDEEPLSGGDDKNLL